MDFLMDFVDWITGMIETGWGFVTSLIDNLTQLFKYIGIAASTGYNLVASLPPWLQAFGTVTVLVSVLFMIVGRSTGGAKNE